MGIKTHRSRVLCVNKLTHRTKHLLAFYKIENKTNLLTFNWDTIKTSFRYLPNTINYIVVKHELDEMSDIEMGNYLMNRNHNYDIGKKDILLTITQYLNTIILII